MPLSRPFFSHRITSAVLRTVVQSAEAAVLYFLFTLLSNAVGAFILHDGPFQLTHDLRFGAVLLVCAVGGGALYVRCRTIVARRGIDTTLSVRIWLVLLTGAFLGALLSIFYWIRPTGPGEFSRPTFTLLGICVGAAMALFLGAIVTWQNRWVSSTR